MVLCSHPQAEPSEKLLYYYQKAEKLTGIEWEVLAAINLVETGMGRIAGVSVANAHGPMQFLKTTWQLPGIGMGGDINDPHDSIQAAATFSQISLPPLLRGITWSIDSLDPL